MNECSHPVLRQEACSSTQSPFPSFEGHVPSFCCKGPTGAICLAGPGVGLPSSGLADQVSCLSTGPSSAVMLVLVLGQTVCFTFPQLGGWGPDPHLTILMPLHLHFQPHVSPLVFIICSELSLSLCCREPGGKGEQLPYFLLFRGRSPSFPFIVSWVPRTQGFVG